MAYIQGSTPSNPHVLTRPECRWSLGSIMKIQVKQSHVKNALCMHAKLLQSCSTLCDPVEHSLPGSSLHGTLQARILEWVAMLFSRGSSLPKDWIPHCRKIFYHLNHRGSPIFYYLNTFFPRYEPDHGSQGFFQMVSKSHSNSLSTSSN